MPSPTANFSWQKPTDAADNDVWGDYLDANLDAQDTLLRSAFNQFIANTSPSVAQNGTFWINNTTNPWTWNIYDGTNWVSIGTISPTNHTFSPSGVSVAAPFYIGDLKVSNQNTNHGSWLLCNGQSISTTTYSGLYALIGYTYGGSGANFKVPDLRGQVVGMIGTGAYSGASARTLGQFVGEEKHTLTSAELPNPITSATAEANFTITNGVDGIQSSSGGGLGGSNGIISNAGGGNSHNTMQPTLFAGSYFIYTGV